MYFIGVSFGSTVWLGRRSGSVAGCGWVAGSGWVYWYDWTTIGDARIRHHGRYAVLMLSKRFP
jgi:hypothetical protein